MALGVPDGHELITSDTFEWAVTAAMSIGAHLAERNYALRFLDAAGEPAFQHSPSAPEPEAEEYIGASGLQSVAESLAAIQLTGPHHNRRDARDAGSARAPGRHPSGAEAGPQPFDDRLMDKLAAHRMRGPVLAILGNLTPAEARALSPAAGFAANAFALVITERARELDDVLETLRLGGWRAVAVTPSTSLPAAWTAFDEDGTEPLAAAPMCGADRGSGNDTDTTAQRGRALRPVRSVRGGRPASPGPGSFPGNHRDPGRRSAHSRGSWPSPWQSPSPVRR